MKKYLLVLFFFTCSFLFAKQHKIAFIVKPYLQNVSSNGITIFWETNLPAEGIVQFGKAKLNSNSVNFNRSEKTVNRKELQAVDLNDLDA